jgi:hypothetical protein
VKDYQIIWVPANAQDQEAWIAISGEKTVGHIWMSIEKGHRLKFMDAWVHPDWRRKGIFRSLWEARWSSVSKRYPGWTIYAWCKANSLPLLLEKGFHAGEECTYVEKRLDEL